MFKTAVVFLFFVFLFGCNKTTETTTETPITAQELADATAKLDATTTKAECEKALEEFRQVSKALEVEGGVAPGPAPKDCSGLEATPEATPETTPEATPEATS